MAQVTAKVLIQGGSGNVIITLHGQPDFNINQSGSTILNLPVGDHFMMVFGRPPQGGTVDISFEQNGDVLASHKYKQPSSILFKLEVS